MVPVDDDFQEISGLLFEAKERYRSVRATILHTIDASVAQEANKRFLDWRFAQPSGSGMAKLGKPGPPVREDFYQVYGDTKEVLHFWHERPDRWREERRRARGELLRCIVAAGRGRPLWIYDPRRRPYTSPLCQSDETPTRTSLSCSTPKWRASTTPS